MKAKRTAPLVAAVALIVPARAQAHISLHPNTIPAGAFATLDVRVPGEQEGAYVKRVDTLFPQGFTGVDYENVAGWTAKVIESKLAKPIQSDDGPIDTEVSQIVWTWTGPSGKVNNGQFIDFPLSVAIPENATGKALEFRTVQTYSNGQVVHWIDQSLTAEHPAPRINVTAKGGVIEDVAGAEAGPTPTQTGATPTGATQTGATPIGATQAGATQIGAAQPGAPAQAPPAAGTRSTGGASKGLGIAALVLGALGTLIGLAALAAARRSGSAT